MMPLSHCARRYTWKQGDTPLGVAIRHGLSEQTLRNANPSMNLDDPNPGTEICLPDKPLVCPSGTLYTVRTGDTIASIAMALSTTPLKLMELNPYIDPDALASGQMLCVPESGGPSAKTAESESSDTPKQRTERRQPIAADPAPCPTDYTQAVVRYGQTLLEILRLYDISYNAFELANPLLISGRLVPGQRYCIPPKSMRSVCSTGNSHLVLPNETPDSIAAQYGISELTLLRLNPLLAPGDFVPGRIVCVPSSEQP